MAYTRDQDTQSKHTEFEWDSVGNPIAQRIIGESNEPKIHADETVDKGNKEAHQAELSIAEIDDNRQTIHAVTEGDRLLSFADIDFDYDDCGNQISELGVGIKTQRGFNAFNQLTSFSKDGVLTQYDYDPLGRRIAKHTEQGQIDFIWDGNQLLGECLNGKYTWYINRPDEFYPVALIKQNSVYYYRLDQLNTPRFVTNQAAEVVWENTANAYGYEDGAQQTREIENTNFYQPIRFQGQYFDQESGFHYNRFRYYCPKQQRFIHQDPIGIVGGINHYQYAPNPVNWVDPMGLLCKEGQAKVAAALDANSAIPEELKEKIIALTKLDDSGYTADEMIGHINNNTVDEMLKNGSDLFGNEPNGFSKIYSKAPEAKSEIDAIADKISDMLDGQVAKAPIKSKERAIQKIMSDYEGDSTQIKDLARNTIIVSPEKLSSAIKELTRRGATVTVIDGATNPLGYSGVNSTIKTKAGIIGEIQVNTPAMIYAKESEAMARDLLGGDLYVSIENKSGIQGGKGHKFYEQWRVLPDSDPRRLEIEASSKEYYNKVRGDVYGN